jgi:UDP:flavonoid glycosyltransferase YjiC (YdhE family)
MRIVLNTFGSFGDIHPYMAIGLELQARGHEAVIATMELYREKIESVGLAFAPVRPKLSPPREQDQDLINKILIVMQTCLRRWRGPTYSSRIRWLQLDHWWDARLA